MSLGTDNQTFIFIIDAAGLNSMHCSCGPVVNVHGCINGVGTVKHDMIAVITLSTVLVYIHGAFFPFSLACHMRLMPQTSMRL